MMEYLLGSPADFHDFVNSISKEDKVGIVTHTDVDGIVSGIFLQKILESKGLKIGFIEFLNYGSGVLEDFSSRRDYDKLFFTDWNVDGDESGFNLLRGKGEVLVVDHHPLNENLSDKKGLIKTESKYCSAHTLFDLAKKYFDTADFDWLVCSAIIMDYTFTEEETFNLIKSFYPDTDKENIFESFPGQIGKKIDNALIYYRPDFRKVYDLVLKKDLDSLEEVNEFVKKEIEKDEKEYLEIAEFYPEKNFYYGFYTPKIARVSSIISKISYESPDKIFIMVADSGSNDGLLNFLPEGNQGKLI
jgi:oligoribonuclease NrnB/cAMP/cGMP phosphodiesterase (DHH superfamily)